ncbi:hypothetical protein V5F49_03560 [Xanthobacter sp. V3C-3]|uniref:hypothetical protein n=1 Tax=Xanthobacter lutulentifluminis TaxID=3119935 RepID=UPI003727D8EB
MNGMETGAAEGPAYACLPRLGGAGVRLSLTPAGLAPAALDWSVGPREGRLPLKDVTAVRLRFLPAKFASRSFEMEIAGRDGTRLKVGSASRISLTGVRDQGPEYAAFVRAFHAALARSPGERTFRGGYGALRFWVMVAVGLAALAGLLAVLGFAIAERQWSFALFLAALGAFVVAPTVETVWRNRLVTYTPDALPPHLLPA